MTESAGRLGSFIIIVIASFIFALTAGTISGKFLTGTKSLLVLIVLLAGFSLLNENLIKGTLRIARPSHTYILKQLESTIPIDSIYSLAPGERRSLFKNLIDHDTIHFKNIDPRILNHWMEEVGYSFPSGHSLTAFLLASILSFAIYLYQGQRVTILSFISLMWAATVAFSRVAIGAHTSLDVSAGAALGLIISHVLLAIPLTRKIILPQTAPFFERHNQK
ncbi:MAG: phosphatase PAP2 family protein [Chryseolinea sp.]